MKYQELLQIKDFFKAKKRLDFIKRIGDNVFELSLDKERFVLDLTRGQSVIYKADLSVKNYNAPFDFLLKKYFTNVILNDVFVPENNRILCFKVSLKKAYKSIEARIYFEFTGKNTNAIITDDKCLILGALRYVEKSYRVVKPGIKLLDLAPFKMDEKISKINDFDKYFKDTFRLVYEKKLNEAKALKLANLDKKIEKIKLNLSELSNEDELLDEAKKLSKMADVLFANLSKIKDYEREFELVDFENNVLKFSLNESAKMSANTFYKDAKKAKQRAKNINIQRQNLQEKLSFLLSLKELVKEAKSTLELDILLPKKEPRVKKDEADLIANFYYNDYKISVGKNERGNELLLKNAKKNDIWLHVKNQPSAHTIISSNKLSLNDDVLGFAAGLCVSFSGLKNGQFLIDYTSRNFVKVRQKAFVNYTNFKTISVVKD